jgi:uncharacterized Zn finger protein (UPF0148 family)
MSYHCGVKNCGNGKCIHRLTEQRCPHCGRQMVEVTTTGTLFCSAHVSSCDYEEAPQQRAHT